MALKKTEISVIMTIYNHDKFLAQSINSIIKQSFKNWELIVFENGSTDKSRKILKKIKDNRIKKYFLKKNIGRTTCLNLALKKCKGQYIAILDSDDYADKNRLKTQFNFLEKNKNIWLVGSWYKLVDEKRKLKKIFKYSGDLNKKPRIMLFKNVIGHSTIMFKKKLIQKIGPYKEKLKYAQDYGFMLKTLGKFKIAIIHKFLTTCREPHKNSETFRVLKSKRIDKERSYLFKWCLKNINTNFIEKIIMIVLLFLKNIKLIRK